QPMQNPIRESPRDLKFYAGKLTHLLHLWRCIFRTDLAISIPPSKGYDVWLNSQFLKMDTLL
ncbi:hypothetical protein, partial [Pantoea septica]|uniref:hypothetical protein n=1 Tax=Pantoea septica TaxID=472695 RepID=UPI00289C5258